MFRLRTPQARGLAVAALIIGCAVSAWRYTEEPPGHIIRAAAVTERVPNSRAAFPFFPDTRTEEEKADKSWHFDMSFHTWVEQCGVNPVKPRSSWPQGVPRSIVHWGVSLCNNAQAPEEFLNEMRPYLRDAAIRDVKSFTIRVMAIPFYGFLAAGVFLLLVRGGLRISRWIRTGS
ncbi:hypothetical protein [Phaeobacter porticola]|uniref:Uncharacterized protein n=1 Tax=Phaeobacter porticola TaxID=1844006 RepID=A0A1L3IAC4_9RHOB|nr:hypothetical protein [Phaeobacter porticola]APG49012.1 hypothetical protein PhaeoP97_03661 [Phaeobacter porticola]